MMKNPSASDK